LVSPLNLLRVIVFNEEKGYRLSSQGDITSSNVVDGRRPTSQWSGLPNC